VTAGYGIATGNPSLVKPTITAVAGSVAGEITWARLLRRPGAASGLLITELALFLLALAGWLAAGSHPAGISALALLALVSVALGGFHLLGFSQPRQGAYLVSRGRGAADQADLGVRVSPPGSRPGGGGGLGLLPSEPG
jgi:hypothetical protein